MRRIAAIACIALGAACGSDSISGGSPEGDSGSDSGSTTAIGDGDDDDGSGSATVPPPWDGSACAGEFSGMLEWSASVDSTTARGPGRALARGPDESLYIVDGCLSRWSDFGIRQWQVLNSGFVCYDLTLDSQGLPIVAAGDDVTLDATSLLLAYDDEGVERWRVTFDDVPGHQQLASSIVTAPDGDLIVAGLVWQPQSPRRTWVARLDPNGVQRWHRMLPEGSQVRPELGLDHAGNPIVAEQRHNAHDVDEVVVTRLDGRGDLEWTWHSTDALGIRMSLTAFATDWAGEVVIAGHDLSHGSSHTSRPALLTTIDPYGTARWTRSGVDVRSLETIDAVGFDPCGSIVLGGSGDLQPHRVTGQIWAAKLDRQGELRWANYLSTLAFSPDNAIGALLVDADGTVWATGSEANPGAVGLQAWAGRFAP